ncbi:hypothetical protein [Nocardioides donggukensis]|uniref:Uncharacterized protein n=1 Tax=Nocardioides donggukensis TaxID=2774019 RepID=A0A927K3Z9_9ACTN|nr:hypothetical protein [Nocardioides donggukensis]MBD8868595.1 hypothetical protein [Nocardioides donggukensis]
MPSRTPARLALGTLLAALTLAGTGGAHAGTTPGWETPYDNTFRDPVADNRSPVLPKSHRIATEIDIKKVRAYTAEDGTFRFDVKLADVTEEFPDFPEFPFRADGKFVGADRAEPLIGPGTGIRPFWVKLTLWQGGERTFRYSFGSFGWRVMEARQPDGSWAPVEGPGTYSGMVTDPERNIFTITLSREVPSARNFDFRLKSWGAVDELDNPYYDRTKRFGRVKAR